MVQTDFENNSIIVREHVLKLKDLVTAKEMKPIQILREKNNELETNGDLVGMSEKEVNSIEREWFDAVIRASIVNETLDSLESKLSLGEIREVSANAYVFLWRFGSKAEAKRYSDILTEMQKNKEKSSKISA